MKIKLLLLVLLLSLILCSCGDSLPQWKLEGEAYIDKKNDTVWYGAPLNFQPVSTGAAAAMLGDTEICVIPDMDSSRWLAEAFEGIGAVYYAEGVTLPTLETFEANGVLICSEVNLTFAMAQSQDKALVDQLVDAIVNGEAVEAAKGNSYHVKFTSAAYPGLYYDLLYIEGEDGCYYLFDRGIGKAVEIGRMLASLMPTDEEVASELAKDSGAVETEADA